MTNRKADPKMTYAELAKTLLNTYDIDPITCELINKKNQNRIQLREGGVISTPFRSVSAQTFLYIMTYGVHPSEDPPESYADRIHHVKSRLHTMQPRQPVNTWRGKSAMPPKPKALTLADKLERLRTVMLLQDKRIEALEIQLRGNADE